MTPKQAAIALITAVRARDDASIDSIAGEVADSGAYFAGLVLGATAGMAGALADYVTKQGDDPMHLMGLWAATEEDE